MEPTQHVVTAFRLPTTLLLNVDFYCLKNDANSFAVSSSSNQRAIDGFGS